MNVIYIFAMRVLAKGGGSDDDISLSQEVFSKHLGYWKRSGNRHSVNICLNGNLGIIHMTTDVSISVFRINERLSNANPATLDKQELTLLRKSRTVSNLLKLNQITSLGSWLLGTRPPKRYSSDIPKPAGASASFISSGRRVALKDCSMSFSVSLAL